MAKRLTTFSKFLITLLIVGAVAFAGYFFLNKTGTGQALKDKAEAVQNEATNGNGSSATSNDGSATTAPAPASTKRDKSLKGISDDEILKVQLFTWGGYAPGVYFNEGFAASKRSRFYTEYGLLVEFVLQDDFGASRQMWRTDQVNLFAATADALSGEMEGLVKYDPQIVMQTDWSRGGDAIVVTREIKNVNDLRGKKVAYTPGTPSMTFLVKTLEAAGMTINDIKSVEMPDNPKAAAAFKTGNVDAACVWSPDDIFCVEAVKGSRVLQSTKEASHLIADVFVGKKSYINANKDKINKFYEGWMKGAAEINSSNSNKTKAAKLLGEGMGLTTEDMMGAIGVTRLTTHGDNQNFFGLDRSYTGVTGEELYRDMGEIFKSLNLAPKSFPDWRQTRYIGAVQAANLSGKNHEPEGGRKFTAPTKADEKLPELSSKPISITFPSGSATLGSNAKTLIDNQFSSVAKSFGNTRIRVEGNTDTDGSRDLNMRLSKQRAEAVAGYLQSEYGMNRNRFIIVGNGPDRPVAGCEQNQNDRCKEKNRRTEFQLVGG